MRPPVSKQKIVDITKAALNALRYFKHVVFIVERFLSSSKCRSAEHRLSVLYVVDSIVRQAKKQFQYKDVYAPRFAINLSNTISNIMSGSGGSGEAASEQRLKVVRVVNLWRANKIFEEAVLDPILQHFRAMGLGESSIRMGCLWVGFRDLNM